MLNIYLNFFSELYTCYFFFKNIDDKLEVVQNALLSVRNQDLLLKLKDFKYVDLVVPHNPNINNSDKNLETVQNTMLPIINQDLLLYLKDFKYVDINNI